MRLANRWVHLLVDDSTFGFYGNITKFLMKIGKIIAIFTRLKQKMTNILLSKKVYAMLAIDKRVGYCAEKNRCL